MVNVDEPLIGFPLRSVTLIGMIVLPTSPFTVSTSDIFVSIVVTRIVNGVVPRAPRKPSS